MQVGRWGAVLGLSAAVVVGTAGIGGASTAGKGSKAKFCKAAARVGEDVISAGDGISDQDAAKLEKQLDKLAKKAPTGDLKDATKEMADYFGEVADGGEDISAGDLKDFGIASGTYGLYLATKCISEVLPDIPLPDITLPDVSLPDITLPDLGT